MTDNTEREAFEKAWPVPMGIRWHDGMYVSEDAEFIKLTLRACYQSAWKGFQAGRASGIESSRDAVIRECAKAAETTPHRSGVNDGGQAWITKATREDCAKFILKLLAGAKP